MSSLFWFIMCHPAVYCRLQDEIDSVFPRGENALEPSKHIHMNYLNAVMYVFIEYQDAQEPNPCLTATRPFVCFLRYSVAASVWLSEVVVQSPLALSQFIPMNFSLHSNVDMNFESMIPEGTAVFSHFYSLHRDPRYFSPLPDTFWPDRWLSEVELASAFPSPLTEPTKTLNNVRVVLDRTAFTPFSFGPSNCVGKNLAIQEIRMVVCLMLQSFDMRLAEGYDAQRWEMDLEDRLITHVGELPVVLTARKI